MGRETAPGGPSAAGHWAPTTDVAARAALGWWAGQNRQSEAAPHDLQIRKEKTARYDKGKAGVEISGAGEHPWVGSGAVGLSNLYSGTNYYLVPRVQYREDIYIYIYIYMYVSQEKKWF